MAPPATLSEARAVLSAHFGYSDFRPPQRRAVHAVLSGHDALIVLPTGGGKSICFQVPALLRGGLTIVISPLISLMKDQVDALERRGIAAAYINSTLASGDVANRLARARDGSLRLLYLAPERLDGGRIMQQVAAIGVSLLAVDEAHCISEWGHDFRPSYRRIGRIRDRIGAPQTVALTATATMGVRDDIMRQLALRNPLVVVGGFDRTNLAYHVVSTRTQQDKDRGAIAWLRTIDGPAVVYTPTRKSVERVAAILTRARVDAVAYHAGLDDAHRQRAQNAFMRGACRVIVATSAFGMGIDKPDVRLVVHHAMPGTLEAYYQEAGRAGRDGQASSCVLLYGQEDRCTHDYFIASAHPGRRIVEQLWRVLCANTTTHPRIDSGTRVHTGRAAHAGPLCRLAVDALTARMPSRTGDRMVEAALRVLARHGALSVEPPIHGRVWIRLLATPARITSQLVGDRSFDRDLLRVCWRAVGARLHTGADIDLDLLPAGLGVAQELIPVLERLADDQFIVWMRLGGGFRLHTRSADPAQLSIDWAVLERRRQSDLGRLAAMEKYSRTRACRRAFVLRYFGDPDARPRCSGCDRCLGMTTALRAPLPAQLPA